MGNMIITAINTGSFRFDLSAIYHLPSGHPYAGQIADVPLYSFHIAVNGRSILVDATGYDPDHVPKFLKIAGYRPPPALVDQMRQQGIDPTTVSDVIITHTHFDHYAGLSIQGSDGIQPAFPNARHYLQQADWHPEQFNAFDDQTLGLINQHQLLNLVQGHTELGDGLTLLHYPGETPGHQTLAITTETEVVYFGGDLIHHPLEFEEANRNVDWALAEDMQASKAAFMKRVAHSKGRVYFTHITPSVQVILQADETLIWQISNPRQ